jgi:putative transposase
MSKSYKKWSKQEKIKIFQAAEQEGVISACRKHEVSTATFYNWKKIYDQHGEAGFQQDKSSSDQRYKKLEEENRMLKKLLVDKDLALEAQKEIVKKKFGTDDLRRI